MLIDDSVVVRGLLRSIIERDGGFEIVGTSPDGLRGVQDYKSLQPDIAIMDIEMPNMDGLSALKEILAFDPDARIIMCSSLTQSGAQVTVEALRIGAVDCLAKPSSATIDRGQSFEDNLLSKLRALAKAPKPGHTDAAERAAPAVKATLASPRVLTQDDLLPLPPALPNNFPLALAVASSTGGPKALGEFLKGLNKKIALPVFITQHIPAGFSRFLAESLEKNTGFTVYEAEDGMVVTPGHVYVAPGGKHMGVAPGAPKKIVLIDTPPVNFCKPSADVMIDNLAEHYGSALLTVVLTGMGSDGRDAIERLVAMNRNNIVLAQDEPSSVVWGMPGAVVQSKLAHAVLPLAELSSAANQLIYRRLPARLL
jgi:two-component system chemotaxis response regulator CheB